MRSSLTLPLLAEGKPIGVVFFSCRDKNVYTGEHAAALKSLAGHIAISLERAQLIAALQQRNVELAEANKAKDAFLETLQDEVRRQTEQVRQSEERYRTLVRLGQIVNASLDLREVFRSAAEEMHKLVDCDFVSLLLLRSGIETPCGFALEFSPRRRWLDIPAEQLPGTAVAASPGATAAAAGSQSAARTQPPRRPSAVRTGLSGVRLVAAAVSADQRRRVWDRFACGGSRRRLGSVLVGPVVRPFGDRLGQRLGLRGNREIEVATGGAKRLLADEIKTAHDFGNIVGDSVPVRRVRAAIEQVAKTDSTVLILGETGTGKELVARAIHDTSPRHERLLVKVNCAALAPALITSELFGHEAGAFTGATGQRQGRFELAQGGSIFLDEIAEIPLETQVMLLRVLQDRTIERVGGNRSIPVDVRVIAATNRDLKDYVEDGHFRSDLFYRLNVFPIHVPTLRERREDIPALINHFITRFARRMNKDITRVNRRTMEQLMSYDWPGNVRELENIVERAVIVSRGDTLEIDPNWLSEGGEALSADRGASSFADIERQAILDALQRCGGKIYGPDGAAALLKLKPTTLYGKMRKQHIARRRRFEHE